MDVDPGENWNALGWGFYSSFFSLPSKACVGFLLPLVHGPSLLLQTQIQDQLPEYGLSSPSCPWPSKQSHGDGAVDEAG